MRLFKIRCVLTTTGGMAGAAYAAAMATAMGKEVTPGGLVGAAVTFVLVTGVFLFTGNKETEES